MQNLRRKPFLSLLLTFSFLELAASERYAMPAFDTSMETAMAAGYGEERISSVLITGSIFCDACLDQNAEIQTSYVAGAKVTVACKEKWGARKTALVEGATDDYGDFIVDLPSHLHAIPKLETACTVRVHQLPEDSPCRHACRVKPRRVQLSSVGNGIRTYTAGVVRLQHKRRNSNRCTTRKEGVRVSSW